MGLRFSAVAVDDRYGDNVWIVGICAGYGYCLAFEVDIAVAGAGVCSRLDFYGIAFVRIAYCSLDVVEVCRGVVIDGDCACRGPIGWEQA